MLPSLTARSTLVCVLAFLCAAAHAQLPAPPTTTEEALRQMFDQAGIVFTGQVTEVRRIDSADRSSGILETDFAVEDAILGIAPGGTYSLREWAGVTPNADSMFVAGRRYLVLLHTPGPSGLTSPVGGSDGIIPILPGNDAASPTAPDALGLAVQAALTSGPRSPARSSLRSAATQPDSTPVALASANVDLRWIAARVLTPIAYAPSEPAAARPIVARAYSIRSSTNFPAPEADRINTTSSKFPAVPVAEPASSSSNYSGLMTLLHSWQAQDHAAR